MEDWEQERGSPENQSREKTSRLLDLPADGVAGVPKVELLGDRELYLENYKGILSYGKEELHVDGGAWVLRISGRDLEIKAMRERELRIFGWVSKLEIL
ncbi:MAG: YabP/YqfC family sporulation protein [Evtepia gabavorous]